MQKRTKIGIIICDRYRRCAGGKCFRSLRNREGAFARYRDIEVDLVGYTTCDGCPGGNIEYTGEEMKKNGAEIIHLATGLIVGYPPCPHLTYFHDFIREQYGLEVVYGTHPIPEKYIHVHEKLGTWDDSEWKKIIEPTLADEKTRLAYD
jgi:predicted metal-binding protein